MSYFELEASGIDELDRKIKSLDRSGGRAEARRAVNDMAEAALNRLKIETPRGRTGTLYRRLSRTRARYVALPNGDGFWEAQAGVERRFPEPMYPIYVHEGTGLWRDRNPDWIRARVSPTMANIMGEAYAGLDYRMPASVINTRRMRRSAGNGVMRFIGRDGRVYFRHRVAGQAPNPFVERAYHMTNLYAGARMVGLANRI